MNGVLVMVFLVLAAVDRINGRASGFIIESLKDEEPYVIEDVVDEPEYIVTESQIQQRTTSANESETSTLARISYSGNQLWKTSFDDKKKIFVLSRLREEEDIKMWGGNATSLDILVKPDSLEKVRKVLEQENIKYEVVIKDLQEAIDEENPPITEEFDNRKGHRLTWQAYHRLNEHHGYLDYIAQSFPEQCTIKTIGHSVQGRPLKVIKISNGKPSNKAIWIDGGIHAREWITPATVTYIIEHLTSNFENEPEYMQNIDWYIAPIMNPDGYEYTHTVDRLWRKNRGKGVNGFCDGTDLNRNFGYKWGGQGSSKNPCSETYGGTGAFSEPETAAIHRFIKGTPANWKAYVSFHSYGQYILYPWGYGRVVPPDYKDLEEVARKAANAIRAVTGSAYTIGPAGSTLYPAAGGSDDWAKGTIKMKYAYTIELRDNGRHGFVLPAEYIQPTAKEALAALRVIAEAAYRA